MAEGTLNKVSVRIMGEDYVVKGKSTPEHIKRLGSYVDSVMAEIRQSNPYLSTMQVAILAAVNISAELFRVKADYEELLELLQETGAEIAGGD
ncbi:MAG: cell division protein ZapA [Firmicutes bacterium]|jgi:cell division protein ZapA|nr:cell division protein ZapA [Bacillota bacterium]